MLFTSVIFLCCFLPLFFLLDRAWPRSNLFLLLASLVFYAWGEPLYLGLLLASSAGNYQLARLIDGRQGAARRRLLLLGVAGNLLLLGFFKYAGFILVETLGARSFVPPPLPLGISFFTFHCLSYLIDVYRGTIPAERSRVDFFTYIALFPHLIAGPIVRYADIGPQLKARGRTLQGMTLGLRLFALGLAQKLLLADQLAPLADAVFAADPASLSPAAAWAGLACFTLQIYFDFAGYSTMARGLALMLGISFPRNFDRPYAAQSVTAFWRRWHITLSSWLRDYLYIPLGGGRRGRLLTARNLVLTFLACGLWHGAAWTFVVWGLWHGLLLLLERIGLGRLLARLPRPARHLYLLLAVMLGWVLFRAADLQAAWGFYGALLGQGSAPDALTLLAPYLRPTLIALFLLGWIAATLDLERLAALRPLTRWRLGPVNAAATLGLLALLLVVATAATQRSFIYFRF